MIHLQKTDYVVSQWTGGTTQQLFINPANASLAKKDFLFRVSSANIELEQSDFSPFPGYKRILLPLDNAIKIQHEGHGEKKLQPLAIHHFHGDWLTSSVGNGKDFNLIYRPELNGNVQVIHLKKDEHFKFKTDSENEFHLLYLLKGGLSHESKNVQSEESLVLSRGEKQSHILLAQQDSVFISVRVSQ